MKKTIYILTFISFALSSCLIDTKRSSDPTTAENEQQDNSENNFENNLKTLDQIPLPLSHNPLGQLPTLSNNYDKKAFEKYKHVWTSQPLGILFSDNKTVTLVDCSIGDWGLVPFLTTYDRQGNKIDSLGPYKKTGEDMGYKAIEYLTISKDKTITISDSVTTYTLKADSSDIDETSRKSTNGSTKYKIETDGRIREQK
nr:hypothetical protein [Bacteroidota bacterium]